MDKEFIKLKIHKADRQAYIRPQDITCLIYDGEIGLTGITVAYSGVANTLMVEETPGQIFEACRKVMGSQYYDPTVNNPYRRRG